MGSKKVTEQKKRVNLFAILSFCTLILVFPLLLIPWHRFIILRSNTLSTLAIDILGITIIGLTAFVLGVIALVRNRRPAGGYKANWMAWAGIVVGAIGLGFGLFFIIDYLRFTYQ